MRESFSPGNNQTTPTVPANLPEVDRSKLAPAETNTALGHTDTQADLEKAAAARGQLIE